ncbi:alpha/beta fold hydrolase [Nocardiopsis trehalosi]|jgi:pimeloyl-ACP methyl ester carboxylesterase|uniref:alpha/beta fold hydrolase n=1 Tax=Nocardiopsis trehalosi TaxID=109329 RepID=UPI000AAFE509|nr:alpha/beta fold hydrolase [Nocardiopsis trehalosi]
MTATGRTVEIGDVELWVEEFGDPDGPPVLLIMGSMSQGHVWPDAFVGRLAAGGRRVIRYDHRDTGRSTAVDFDAHPYTWTDIRDDAIGLLDALGIGAAHIVGHSAGGLLGQWIAVTRPERVATLTVIGASPLGRREGEVVLRALMGEPQDAGALPPPKAAFTELFQRAATAPPPATRAEYVDFQVEVARVLHGPALPFDADAQRAVEERLYDRARVPGSEANHRRAAAGHPHFEPEDALGGITAPTLVVEGSEEPVKPGHGRLIAAEIPGAEYLEVPGMGHTLPAEAHAPLAEAVLAHTGRAAVAAG